MKEEEIKGPVENENPFADVAQEVKEMVTAVSDVIKKYPILASKNFGLFYQHGRLGYMDLDIFAEKVKENEKETLDKTEE